MAVLYANEDNFKEIISEGLVLLDFYADWCAPCKMIGPVLEQVAEQEPGIKVVKVNVDENRNLAVDYEVRGIPALFVVKDGVKVADRAGFATADQLIEWVKNA